VDLGLYFFIAVIIAFATWLIGMIWGYKAKQAIITIAAMAVILPIVIIFIAGWWGMLHEPGSGAEIANKTIEAIINYIVNKLPYILVSDVAGVLVGAVVGSFTRRSG
jgi:hypothetical protein